MSEPKPWAEAYIDGTEIRIRVDINVLQNAMRMNPRDDSCAAFHVTDALGFAKDVVSALNEEAEDGTTPVHEMLDAAIAKAIDDGSEHVEEREAEVDDDDDAEDGT